MGHYGSLLKIVSTLVVRLWKKDRIRYGGKSSALLLNISYRVGLKAWLEEARLEDGCVSFEVIYVEVVEAARQREF